MNKMEFQFTHKFIINEQSEEVIQKNVPYFFNVFLFWQNDIYRVISWYLRINKFNKPQNSN